RRRRVGHHRRRPRRRPRHRPRPPSDETRARPTGHGPAARAEGRKDRPLMCGIVAILGRHEVAPLILEALKRLEYRGYDSAGIATLQDGRLPTRRAVGKLIALSD